MDAHDHVRALLFTLPIALWAIDARGIITMSRGGLLAKPTWRQ